MKSILPSQLIAMTHCCISVLSLSPQQRLVADDACILDRRRFFRASSLVATAAAFVPSTAVQAKGLVQFPLTKPLFNTYSFMRVGTTLLEEEDIWSTNPLFLTNRDDALSGDGQSQVQSAIRTVWGTEGRVAAESSPSSSSYTSSPTIVIHSLAASAIDTANILQQTLQLGRDRIRPEFTLLDPRGIGKFDSLTRSTTQPAVWALDADTMGGKPPPNEDGTPNESLEDQAVRLRQLLSNLETQYSGESILLVFPDGTGPAVLACLMAGIPLTEVHRLEFGSAEIRTNVTPTLVKTWYQKAADQNQAYQQTLAQGRLALRDLYGQEELINRKDEKMEAERLAYEESQQKKVAEQAAAEAKAEEQRRTRAEQIRQTRKEQQQQRREKDELALPSSKPDSFLLSLTGGVAVSALGLAQLYSQDSAETNSVLSNDPAEDLVVDSEHSIAAGGQPSNAATGSLADTKPLTWTETSSSLSELGNPVGQVNGDSMATFSGVQDKTKAIADQATKDYLEQDDGGDAWLSSIVEILEEDGDENEAK